LRLRKIVTANLKWKEAMDLIKQAEIVDGMSSYLSISIRDRLGKYIPLPLDLTKVREYKE
jgi:hypothetical protein